MCSLSIPAGIGISDKRTVKERIENPIDSMVQEAVTHTRLVYVAWFRVANSEVFVAAVAVRACYKVAMQRENVLHQIAPEFLHVLLSAFASHEFLPGSKKIFYQNDILVCMQGGDAGHGYKTTPPPETFTST